MHEALHTETAGKSGGRSVWTQALTAPPWQCVDYAVQAGAVCDAKRTKTVGNNLLDGCAYKCCQSKCQAVSLPGFHCDLGYVTALPRLSSFACPVALLVPSISLSISVSLLWSFPC
eukprot:767696-Hanusia_phi.AAC.8